MRKGSTRSIDFVSLAIWTAITRTVPYDYALSLALYYGPLAWLLLAVMRLALSFTPAPGPRAMTR